MYGSETDMGPRGTFETYRAEGDGLYKNGDYKKAIESYTIAIELRQGDKDCLVARSRCHLQLGDTHHALLDAEASLKEEPNFHKGLYQKAEALYCQGEFELALVFYHRGHKMRPELQEFRLGIQKAQEAIDNSVGSPEKVTLTKEGDLTFFEQLAEPPKKGRGKAKPKSMPIKKKAYEPASTGSDRTVKQLLGELYGDRMYLEKLLKETANVVWYCYHIKEEVRRLTPRTIGESDTNSPTGKSIHGMVCDGLKYLDTRTDFWRQQKPMYARKRDRLRPRGGAARHTDRASANQYVLRELEKIDEEQNAGNHPESLKRARKCLKTIEGYPDEAVQNRAEIVANLHSCLGNSYLEMAEYEKSLHHHGIDKDISDKNNLDEGKSRALDNLGRVYARTGQYKKAIDVWEDKIPLSKSPLESTWLYHEIGRCYLELGQHSEARDYGEKSGLAAEKANDDVWVLNATVLVAQAEVKMKDYQAALGSFEKALDRAKLQGDETAETAIKKAMADVNKKIVKELKNEKETEETKPTSESEENKDREKTPPPPTQEREKTPPPPTQEREKTPPPPTQEREKTPPPPTQEREKTPPPPTPRDNTPPPSTQDEDNSQQESEPEQGDTQESVEENPKTEESSE